MNSIDITDSTFALNMSDVAKSGDYTMYLYVIGAVVIACIVIAGVYAYFQSKSSSDTSATTTSTTCEDDCYYSQKE